MGAPEGGVSHVASEEVRTPEGARRRRRRPAGRKLSEEIDLLKAEVEDLKTKGMFEAQTRSTLNRPKSLVLRKLNYFIK